MEEREERQEEGQCWSCGSTEHFKRDCPKKGEKSNGQEKGKEKESANVVDEFPGDSDWEGAYGVESYTASESGMTSSEMPDVFAGSDDDGADLFSEVGDDVGWNAEAEGSPIDWSDIWRRFPTGRLQLRSQQLE
ncbi:hypothetical protein BDZ89DRAFT_1055147 [Hymenopellis radicata]|nr:hypothetical protein BDZ89DRAFT_1055147 [Hymenopellis radicata]